MPDIRTTVCAAALTAAFASSAYAQVPATFTNLQVLPKDIPRAELVATMRGFAGALGVRCTYCHVGPDDLQGMDFATDQKESKKVARTMLKMVRSINADFVSTLPAADNPRQPVGCITCHRRERKPPRPLSDMLLHSISTGGVPAAVAEYQKLRATLLDAGLYDFREPTLSIVATRLREEKKFAEALGILRLNAEMFPKSAAVQVNLGDTAMQKGEPALAEGFYKRALELDPQNVAARKSLDALAAKKGK